MSAISKLIKIVTITATLIGLTNSAYADTKPNNTQAEINHLLNFVSTTTCQYERNGDLHDGKAAKKHINKKYKYFEDDIKSAEDFIEYSATKSTMSKKKYKIHCTNKPVQNSKQWLLSELKRYRSRKKIADVYY